ncbi:hypothetical protein K7432_005223 [Basidiobolus ranarum]|uniref:Carbonic anhydrase n=1 Tax=Basidiobolus ranarum TaxID=34480 RepID=A0ABR2W3E3_9FUNG
MLLKFTAISLFQLLLGISASQVHWGYSGQDGPAKWGALDPAYATCGTGKYQSPIDLTRTSAEIITDQSLQINWPNLRTHGLQVTNNGHTLQVDIPDHTNLTMTRDGVAYRLGQFHIHTPSEHHILGKYFDMEIHFVMKNAELNKNHVVGIVFEVTNKKNKFINQLSNNRNIPTIAGQSIAVSSLDFQSLFNEIGNVQEYWAYEGSLTTPPCTVNMQLAYKCCRINLSLT